MKTILFLAPILLLAFGCSKDDNSPGASENQPPESFDLISVDHNATEVDLRPQFSWEPTTDPEGGEVTYALSIGMNPNDLTETASGLTDPSFALEDPLALFTTHYWKVTATDNQGGTTESETNAFTTRNLNDAVQTSVSAGFLGRTEMKALAFDNKLWVIGGHYNGGNSDEVWNTEDGLTWNLVGNANFNPVYYHETFSFDGKMWVLCGYDGQPLGQVYSSTDGITWSTNPGVLPLRYDHTAVVFDGKMWVIGGTDSSNSSDYKNDVWYSTDGVLWTQATLNAGFSPRRGHSTVVYDGKMWVIGGQDASNYKDDVWSSTDGINWTEETPGALFSDRAQHLSVVYGGKMWVISGTDGNDLNDVWWSKNGIEWHEAFANAAFTPRRFAAGAVYDDKIWIIGGYDGNYLDDVWYMD